MKTILETIAEYKAGHAEYMAERAEMVAFEPALDALTDWRAPLQSDQEALAALKLMELDLFMSSLQETMHARLVEYFEARVSKV